MSSLSFSSSFRCLMVMGQLLTSLAFGQSAVPCHSDPDVIATRFKAPGMLDTVDLWLANAHEVSLTDRIQELVGVACPLHDTLLALAFHSIGINYGNTRMDDQQVIRFNQRALALRSKYFPYQHPDIIKGYNNIGIGYYYRHLDGYGYYLDSAQWALEKSLTWNLSRPQPTTKLGDTYLTLGRIAEDLGDAEQAANLMQAAIEHWQRLGGRARAIAIAQNDLASLYASELRNQSQAQELVKQALAYFGPQNPPSRARDSIDLGDWHMTAGKAQMNQENFQAASAHFQQAMAYKRAYASTPWVAEEIRDIHNNQAVLANRQGQYEKAQGILLGLIAQVPDSTPSPRLAMLHHNLGDAHAGLHQWDQALTAYQHSLRHYVPTFSADHAWANPPIDPNKLFFRRELLEALRGKAQTLVHRFEAEQSVQDLHLALATYRSADSLVHLLRQGMLTKRAKTSLMALSRPLYEQAIHTCLLLAAHTSDPAYQSLAWNFAENSRATLLLEVVNRSQGLRNLLSPSTQDQLRHLRQRQTYFATEGTYSLDSLIKYQEAEQALLQQVAAEQPALQRLLNSTALENHSSAHQLSLGADQGLIEYFVGEKELFIFLITSTGIRAQALKLDVSLQKLVAQLRQAISVPEALDDLSNSTPDFLEAATTLFEQLILPLGDLSSLPDQLTIVRDDVLELLPFEVLLTAKVDPQSDFASWPYLIKDKVIHYAYSARLQQIFASNQVSPQREMITFAPVDFSQVQRNYPQEQVPDLPNLFGTEREIELVAPADTSRFASRIREEAKLQAFLTEATSYAIVYLASHGILSAEDYRQNGIAFHDSILFASALHNLQLQADLVVLRACQTGLGELVPGEGLMGLRYGFAQTGAKSVFATQWMVPNAAKFMQTFMMGLQNGLAKDEALRAAKLEQLQQAHPFYWAAYELNGDMSRLAQPNGAVWPALFWPLMLILSLVVLVGAWWYLQKRRDR